MKKTIIITGTRKGIGRSLAEHYLTSGYEVFGCSRSPSDLNHGNYHHYELDVCDERAVVKMVNEAFLYHRRIDALINNAGIASMNALLLTPMSSLESIFSTNVFGSFLFLREVAKKMIRQKTGRIINLSTVAHPLQLEGESVYAASKAAVESFTKISARELGGYGITVNAIGPTPIETDLIKNVSADKMNALLSRQAIRRYGTAKDVINLTDFLLQNDSDFITGQVIYLGGVS